MKIETKYTPGDRVYVLAPKWKSVRCRRCSHGVQYLNHMVKVGVVLSVSAMDIITAPVPNQNTYSYHERVRVGYPGTMFKGGRVYFKKSEYFESKDVFTNKEEARKECRARNSKKTVA